MYPQFSATRSQGVGLLLDLGLARKRYRTLQQFLNNLKRSFKANTGPKPPKILPPRQQMEKASKATWGPLKSKSVVVGSSISVHWCISHWLVYLHSTSALWSTIKMGHLRPGSATYQWCYVVMPSQWLVHHGRS